MTPRRADRDLSKLPLWAQQAIESLEQEVTYWQGKVLGDDAESDTMILHSHNLARPLASDTRIMFGAEVRVAPNGYRHRHGVEAYWDARQKELVVMGGEHLLAVLPRAANSLRIAKATQ